MKTTEKHNQKTIPKLFGPPESDNLTIWRDIYFEQEVTTAERSQKEQRRDLQLFLDFLFQSTQKFAREQWTPRLSRLFLEELRSATKDGQRRWSDKTIQRIVAHLKTFAKWVHHHRAFTLGNPMEKIKLPTLSPLAIYKALTEQERRKLLDAADALPVIGGRSRDKRRFKKTLPNERPRRKGYCPWRNRAIIYTLIETGIRRAEVTTIDINKVDTKKNELFITEKGGQERRCQISREGMQAIQDYIIHERECDSEHWTLSVLFLAAKTAAKSTGRLSPITINHLWREVCQLANVSGKTPHSARHAMGLHIIKTSANPRAVQLQLGHKNPATTMQYLQFGPEELQNILDNR